MGRGFSWHDAGSAENLQEASQLINIIEKRIGYKIGCIEEIAYNNNWITKINLKRWMRIIITRSISIIPCVIVALTSYNSVDKLTFWCNIIQAIQLPFALLPILHFTSSKRIMGPFRVKMPLKLICYMITICVVGINVYFSLSLIVS